MNREQTAAPSLASAPTNTRLNRTPMAKRMDVGSSWRTRAKHALMNQFVAREVRAANSLDWIDRMCWIDLTAGDGAAAYDAPWYTACSPGILAGLAATSRRKAVIIDLYEKDQTTYEKLLANLAEQLPLLGYEQTADNRWRLDDLVWLRAVNGDGRDASLDHLAYQGIRDAVLVLNDPNVITDWAMRRGFMNEILSRPVKGLRIMSTLGCNVCGVKRYPLKKDGILPSNGEHQVMDLKERENWFRLVDEQQAYLPDRHDLALAAFERDSAQWAYLLTTPAKQRWYAETEADVRTAFEAVGHTGEMAYYRRDNGQFDQVKDRLFLTAKELAERANTPLPVDGDTTDPGGTPYRSYREYLKHPRFLAVRAVVFERADGVCERCKSRPPTEPHHLRYPPWGTFDVPENMIAICHPCHCEIHGKSH